jgi:undecaprenyl-diphosphatase
LSFVFFALTTLPLPATPARYATGGDATYRPQVHQVVLVVGALGAVVLSASIVGARRAEIPATERRVFRAVNGLPDAFYWPLWVPMQLGNLVVGMALGLLLALVWRDAGLAVAVVFAVALKLVAERVLRRWLQPQLEVRQRPGTSEPGARLRGDVPASGPSFPSGHVILVAAVGTVVAAGSSATWSLVPLALMLLVGLGRVYVGAHNPLDVTAGLGAGLLVGALLSIPLR